MAWRRPLTILLCWLRGHDWVSRVSHLGVESMLICERCGREEDARDRRSPRRR